MKTGTIFSYMSACVDNKRKMGKNGTADLYRTSSNRFRAFCAGRELCWEEITEEMVDGFETHLEKEKLARNSINSYLSNLRAMYNSAVKEGLVDSFLPNPFTHLTLRREKTEKRALPQDAMARMLGMDLDDNPEQQKALDFYVFSYLACGMPFIDLIHLTEQNIHGDRIVYKRAKTGIQVSVGITPGMRVILNRYSRPEALYLFPILPDKEKVSYEFYKSRLRYFNGYLKRVGEELGMAEKLTFYVARHSWATHAQEMDIPLSVISQALGHTSEQTTRIYLAGLSQEKLNKANGKVTRSIDSAVCRRAYTLFRK